MVLRHAMHKQKISSRTNHIYLVHVERDLDPFLGLVEGVHHAHHVEGVQAVHYGGSHLGVLPKDGSRVATLRYWLQLIVTPGVLYVAIPCMPGHLLGGGG